MTFTLGAEATFFVNCDGKSSLAFICMQVHAKKVVSNSPGLVDFFRLANSFPSLSKRQVKFFFLRNPKYRTTVVSPANLNIVFGRVKMTLGVPRWAS